MTKEKIEIEKEKQRQYEIKCQGEKTRIKCQKHHFFKLLWYYIKKPFVWLFDNIKDWRTAVIFGIVFLIVSSEVWVSYLLGFIFMGTPFGTTMLSVASLCRAFWLGPFTPFTPLCIIITMITKETFNKLRFKKLNEESKIESKEI